MKKSNDSKKPTKAQIRDAGKSPIRNYAYGAQPPTDPAQREILHDQLLRSNRYYNDRIQIERGVRDYNRSIRTSVSPDLEDLEREVDTLEAEYEALRLGLAAIPDPERKGRSLPKDKRDGHPIAVEKMAAMERVKRQKKAIYEKIKGIRGEIDKRLEISGQTDTTAMLLICARHVAQMPDNPKDDPKRAIRRIEARGAAAKILKRTPPTDTTGEAYQEYMEALRAVVSLEWCGPRTLEKLRKENPIVDVLGQDTWQRAAKDQQRLKRQQTELVQDALALSRTRAGQYLRINKSCTSKFQRSIFQPKYVAFDQTGAVGIEISIKDGLTVSKALQGTDRLHIRVLDGESPFRGNGAAARLVDSMPDAIPEQIVEAALQKGFRRFTTKIVEEIRQRKRRTHDVVSGPRLAVARILIGSKNQKRGFGQDYIDVPFIMHRPLPPDGVITHVYLHQKRVGVRKEYEVIFTLRAESLRQSPARERVAGHYVPAQKKARIAINHGWRVLGNGDIRVATTWDGEKEDHVDIPAKLRERNDYAKTVLGICDTHFEETRDLFVDWLRKTPMDLSGIRPDWLDTWQKTAHVWRAHKKLVRAAFTLCNLVFPDHDKQGGDLHRLWQAWRAERLAHRPSARDLRQTLDQRARYDLFLGFEATREWLTGQGITNVDQQFIVYLDWWRRKDLHLTDMARGIEKSIQLAKREIYRNKAALWAASYEEVVVEEWDKSKTAQLPAAEDDQRTKQDENSNAIRQFVGIYQLTLALKGSFGEKRFVKRDPTGITATHYGCGGASTDPVNESRMLSCPECGKHFDQDLNAARALWASESQRGDKRGLGARKRNPRADDTSMRDAAE